MYVDTCIGIYGPHDDLLVLRGSDTRSLSAVDEVSFMTIMDIYLFASFIVLLILIVMPITARISSSLESAGVAAEIWRSCLWPVGCIFIASCIYMQLLSDVYIASWLRPVGNG